MPKWAFKDFSSVSFEPATVRDGQVSGVRINTPEEGDVYAPAMGELKVQHPDSWETKTKTVAIVRFVKSFVFT